MPRLTNQAALNPRDWAQVCERATQFELAWRETGASPDLARFLPSISDPLRRFILEELIKTEMEIRWRRGDPVKLEDYCDRFPELGRPADLSPALIFEEYWVRHRCGDQPALFEYARRFPAQHDELRRLVEREPAMTLAQEPSPAPSTRHQQQGPAAMMTEKGVDIGRGYERLKRIGRGGFGDVWLAKAPGDVKVAVKIISRPIDDAQAQRELHALEVIKGLSHPGLLGLHAFWVEDERLTIVMELADCNLRDRLKQCLEAGQPSIPRDELLRYMSQMAEALDYLHEQRVLHRDIKPDNILLRNNYAKLADLGLARNQESAMSTVSHAGTLAYMPPEVWRGKAGPASDLYSLAYTYVELRLNRRPYAQVGIDLMLAQVEGPPDLNGLPDAERQVMQKALDIDPKQRYSNCQTWIEALKRAVQGGPELLIPVLTAAPKTVQPVTGGKTAPGVLPPTAEPPVLSVVSQPRNTISPSVRAPNLTAPVAALVETPASKQPEPDRQKSGTGSGWFPYVASGLVTLAFAVGLVLSLSGFRKGSNGQAALNTAEKNTNPSTTAPPVLVKGTEKPERDPLSGFLAGFQAAPGARLLTVNDSPRYSRLVRQLDGLEVPFLLIPCEDPSRDPPAFYLMEHKVSNAVFRRFVQANPSAASPLWASGGLAGGRALGSDDPKLPAFRMTRPEAVRAAQWLGGRLPAAHDLDKAAGYFQRNGRDGPASDSGGVAVRRSSLGPRHVDEPGGDVSLFGIADLAGNGKEWTRDTVRVGDEELAVLRGQSYTAEEPLRFTDLEARQQAPLTQFPNQGSAYTGFRVVVDLPESKPSGAR